MAGSIQGRRRTACSLRRSLILKEPVPDSEAARALIIRWIGAAARRQIKATGEVGPDQAGDTVVTLTWDQTFGRPVRRQAGGGPADAVILAMRPRP